MGYFKIFTLFVVAALALQIVNSMPANNEESLSSTWEEIELPEREMEFLYIPEGVDLPQTSDPVFSQVSALKEDAGFRASAFDTSSVDAQDIETNSTTGAIVLPGDWHLTQEFPEDFNYTRQFVAPKVTCETTLGSPIGSNVYYVGLDVSGWRADSWCCVIDERCSWVWAAGHFGEPYASTDICNILWHPGMVGRVCTRCPEIGRGNLVISQKCRWRSRAGGRYTIPGKNWEVRAFAYGGKPWKNWNQ